MSQGPQAGALRESLGIPAGIVVEGMFTARQGTHLLDFGGEGSAHAPTFPAAAAATNVGGQGAHWTCATPSPAFSEKVPFIADDEWDDLHRRPPRGCCTCRAPRSRTPPSASGIRSLLEEEFARRAARGLRPEHAPGRRRPAARRHDAVGRSRRRARPAHRAGQPARRALRAARPHARAARRARGRTSSTGVTVEDLRTRETSFVPADLVVVAADAFRSPQLLWASGIRPAALGHYLTEHPVVISTVALDADKIGRFATEEHLDAELARRAVERGRPGGGGEPHPVLRARPPVLAAGDVRREPRRSRWRPTHPTRGNRWGYVNMGYGMRKQPRYEDAVTFDDDELDYRGFPNMTIELRADADAENAEIDGGHRAAAARGERARHVRRRAAADAERLEPALHGHACAWARPTTAPRSPTRGRACGATTHLVVGGNALIPTANAMNPTLMSVAIAVRGARKAAEQLRAEAGAEASAVA